MAAKRAEIMKKVAEARAAQERAAEETLDKTKFGTHKSITCDGCGTVPLVGYRWRCKQCKNHDLCDTCHEVCASALRLLIRGPSPSPHCCPTNAAARALFCLVSLTFPSCPPPSCSSKCPIVPVLRCLPLLPAPPPFSHPVYVSALLQEFKGGKLPQTTDQMRCNPVSSKVEVRAGASDRSRLRPANPLLSTPVI